MLLKLFLLNHYPFHWILKFNPPEILCTILEETEQLQKKVESLEIEIAELKTIVPARRTRSKNLLDTNRLEVRNNEDPTSTEICDTSTPETRETRTTHNSTEFTRLSGQEGVGVKILVGLVGDTCIKARHFR